MFLGDDNAHDLGTLAGIDGAQPCVRSGSHQSLLAYIAYSVPQECEGKDHIMCLASYQEADKSFTSRCMCSFLFVSFASAHFFAVSCVLLRVVEVVFLRIALALFMLRIAWYCHLIAVAPF